MNRDALEPASEEESSARFLYVVTTGRRTLQKRVAKLRFVSLDRSLCVLTGFRRSTPSSWLLNLFSGKGEAYVASENHFGRITKVSVITQSNEKERARITSEFTKKYGKDFLSNYDYTSAKPVLVEFQSLHRPPDLIQELEFDFLSNRYTSSILRNPISKWEREVSVNYLSRLFRPGENILEIGCGTGIETLPLAKRRKVKILAVDISQEMLSILADRAKEWGLESQVKTRKLSTSCIDELWDDPIFPREGLDGVFSNFGAMNLERDLREFSSKLSRLLKSGAPAVFTVWNRLCLSGAVAAIIERDFRSLRERMSGIVRANERSHYSLDTFAYRTEDFASNFKKEFRVVSHFALPAMIPPPEYYGKLGVLLRFRKMDLGLGRLPILRSLGDNFVITLRRR